MIPPLGELIKIGKAVEMKMGYFISPGAEQPMTVVRREARPAVSRYGNEAQRAIRLFLRIAGPRKGEPLHGAFSGDPDADPSPGIIHP